MHRTLHDDDQFYQQLVCCRRVGGLRTACDASVPTIDDRLAASLLRTVHATLSAPTFSSSIAITEKKKKTLTRLTAIAQVDWNRHNFDNTVHHWDEFLTNGGRPR